MKKRNRKAQGHGKGSFEGMIALITLIVFLGLAIEALKQSDTGYDSSQITRLDSLIDSITGEKPQTSKNVRAILDLYGDGRVLVSPCNEC